MTPSIATPTEALEAARAARERVRGQSPSDPARREALTGVLGSLTASWTAEHENYMRSGPIVGRAHSSDPVRVLARQRREEVKRLRRMLNTTTGTPRPTRTITAAQMTGHINRMSGVIADLARRHADAQSEHGRGGWTTIRGGGTFWSMRALNGAATDLLEELRDERRALRTAWGRYERHVAPSNPKRPYAEQDERDLLSFKLGLVRAAADELTAELRESQAIKATTRGAWTFQAANAALQHFRKVHGRAPTKAECGPAHDLPTYNRLRQLLGPSPLTL